MTIEAARDRLNAATDPNAGGEVMYEFAWRIRTEYPLALDVVEAYERRDKARVEMARQGGAVESGVVNEWYEAVDALSVARAAFEAATE